MIRYFNEKLIEAEIAAEYGVEGTEIYGKLALQELQPIVKYLNGIDLKYGADRFNALQTTIDEDFFNFIKCLFALCAENPLLETESTIEYPVLNRTKKKTEPNIYSFINYVYKNELPGLEDKAMVDQENFIICKPSLFRRARASAGEIIVFTDFLEGHRTMVLQRRNNIRDFVFSAGSAVELLDNGDQKYSNALHVMENFMINRSNQYLTDRVEARKQQRAYFDNINDYVRGLYKIISNLTCEEFNKLPIIKKLKVLDLADCLLGMGLAADNNITLQTIMDGDIMNGTGANLESIGSSYAKVEDAIKEKSDELRSHGYVIKK